MLRIVIVLILGILCGDRYGEVVLPGWIFLLLSGLAVALSMVVKGRPTTVSCLIMLAVFSLGFFLISAEEASRHHRFPTYPFVYEGVLMSQPVETGRVVRCQLLVTKVSSGDSLLELSVPVEVQASILRDTVEHHYRELSVGDGLAAYSQIESGQTFIYWNHWKRKEARLEGLSYVQRARLRLLRFRHRLVGQLVVAIPDDSRRSVISAMTLGDKSSLTREIRHRYSVTGVSHVLALSGLHLSIITAFLLLCFRGRWRQYGQLLVLPAVWLFAMMVGLAPSVVRAATMLTVYAFIALLGRRPLSLNTLSLAAAILLAVSPLSLWDVGFQLSFMAVLGITLFYSPFFQAMGSPNGRILRWVVGMIAVSLSTQLMTAPLVAYYFGHFSSYFLLTNLLAIPLVTLILNLSLVFFLLLAIGLLPGISVEFVLSFVAFLLNALVGVLNSGLSLVSSLPGASVENIRISVSQVFLIYVLMACAVGIVFRLRRIWRYNRIYRMR